MAKDHGVAGIFEKIIEYHVTPENNTEPHEGKGRERTTKVNQRNGGFKMPSLTFKPRSSYNFAPQNVVAFMHQAFIHSKQKTVVSPFQSLYSTLCILFVFYESCKLIYIHRSASILKICGLSGSQGKGLLTTMK